MGPYLNTAKNSSVGATNAMPLSAIRRWKCRRHHGRTRLRGRVRESPAEAELAINPNPRRRCGLTLLVGRCGAVDLGGRLIERRLDVGVVQHHLLDAAMQGVGHLVVDQRARQRQALLPRADDLLDVGEALDLRIVDPAALARERERRGILPAGERIAHHELVEVVQDLLLLLLPAGVYEKVE